MPEGSKPRKETNDIAKAIRDLISVIRDLEKIRASEQKISLNAEVRYQVGAGILGLGNLVFVGTVIAQLVPGTEPFRSSLAYGGVAFTVGTYLLGYKFMKGGVKL